MNPTAHHVSDNPYRSVILHFSGECLAIVEMPGVMHHELWLLTRYAELAWTIAVKMYGLKSLTLPVPTQLLNLPYKTKVTVLSVTATFALIGLFTALFRWKKRKKGPIDRRRRFLEIQREREKAGPLSQGANGGTLYSLICCLIWF